MNKSIHEQDFFTRDPKEVAVDLLGKYICIKNGEEKFLITETEAYYHDEPFCYGYGKTKTEAKQLVSAALFERPGTWCVYNGQLLLSAVCGGLPDNVLIKRVKNKAGELLGPDKMAYSLHLYISKPDYCDCRGRYSLAGDSCLYLTDGEEVRKVISSKRVRIQDDKELNFKMG